MTAKIQAATRRANEAELAPQFPDGFCHTTSIGGLGRGKAGTIAHCPLNLAARDIVAGTHRLSTPQEISAFEAEQAQRRAQSAPLGSALESARAHFAALVAAQEAKKK